MNLGTLIDNTIDQEHIWTWSSCCICGDRPSDFGLYITGSGDLSGNGLDRASQIVRVAWCDAKGCVEDRLGTPHIAVPDELAA